MGSEREPASPADHSHVTAQARTALMWSFANVAIGRLGTLTIGIVLARLLGPQNYAPFNVAMVALFAVLSLNDLGVSLAIVRWPGDPLQIAPTVFSLCVLSSGVLAMAMLAAAGPFAQAMEAPDAAGVVRFMAISVLIDGVVATHAALLQRGFRQKRKALVDQTNTWLGAVVSLVLALMGFGAMSLAIGRVIGSLVSAAMFVQASPWRTQWGWDRAKVRELLKFGSPLAVTSLIVWGTGYADQLLIGNLLGSVTLALYAQAVNLAAWPISMFSQPLRSVAPALFARMQHDPGALNRVVSRVFSLLMTVTVPACVFLSVTAGPVVHALFGTKWDGSESALRWLALAALARIAIDLCYDFLVVTKQSSSVLFAQVVWLGTLLPAVALSSRFGLSGVALGQVAVGFLVVVPVYLQLLRRSGVPIRSLLGAVWLPGAAGTALWFACWALMERVSGVWLQIIGCAALTTMVLGALVWKNREILKAVRQGSLA